MKISLSIYLFYVFVVFLHNISCDIFQEKLRGNTTNNRTTHIISLIRHIIILNDTNEYEIHFSLIMIVLLALKEKECVIASCTNKVVKNCT